MDTAVTMGELALALGAFWVISKALIGRLGELGFLHRTPGCQQ